MDERLNPTSPPRFGNNPLISSISQPSSDLVFILFSFSFLVLKLMLSA